MAPKVRKPTTASELSPEAKKRFNELARVKDEVFTLRPDLDDAALDKLAERRKDVAEEVQKFSKEHFG
jgi:hypothetical protein